MILVNCFFSYSQQEIEYTEVESGIEYTIDHIKKRISFYSDDIVRVSLVKKEKSFHDTSLVVLEKPQKVNFSINNKQKLLLRTSSIIVEIDKKTGRLSFKDTRGTVYVEEHPADFPILHDTIILDNPYYKIKQSFKITEEEGLYGLGQFQNGYMNYRDKELLLVQANTISIVPVLTSTNNYGILWDNYSKTVFKEENNTASFTSEVADQIDYYFMAGNDMDEVVSAYRETTGKAPMFSKKAYGFWQSKERYKSFDELHDVVKKYRENNIPLDNIIQDWQYWGDWKQFSSMYFEPINYPNPAENIKKLRANNADIMVSLWPAVGPESKIYKELEEKGYLFGLGHWFRGEVFDAYSPLARDIYWKHIKEGLVKNGIHNFWVDGTEPQFFISTTQKTSEEELLKVEETAAGPIAKYLNTYALVNNQVIYEKHRAYTADKRVFILTRSSWAGQQRNAMATWSGDIPANFETLKNQISAGVNFSMAGVPYWTHDIGGFFTGSRGGQYLRGIESSAYQELYTRWFQFGAFSPIFRSHGTNTVREVWQFKERNPMCYDALLKTLNLRYQLIPYIYSTAWKVTNEGYSFMRGLVMDFANDKNSHAINDQYLFGSSIMVKPITKNMYYEVEPIPPIIESKYLETIDGETGLHATFYEGIEKFNGLDVGKVIHEETHKEINFDWNFGELPASVPSTNFWVFWEGSIIAPETGRHALSILADDGYKLYVKDQKVAEAWGNKLSTYEIDLEKGEKYPVRIEYAQGGGDAKMSLCWVKPSDKNEETFQLNITDTVYLPEYSPGWYDLWTNQFYEGGQYISKEYPMDIFPLFVKAGSIIPFGPVQQYVDEKPNAPIEIRVYTGADATFVYYEDEGNNYNYEKGAFNTIQFSWNDTEGTLSIGKSTGSFTGYKKDKIFNITVVDPLGNTREPKKTRQVECKYDGSLQLIEIH